MSSTDSFDVSCFHFPESYRNNVCFIEENVRRGGSLVERESAHHSANIVDASRPISSH